MFRPGRRALASGLCLPVVLMATGCIVGSGGRDLASTPVDLERAERAWSDPWLAPSEATVATFSYGSDGQVDRTVGSRQITYPGEVADAVRAEVGAATAGGWRVVASTCAVDRVGVQLARGGSLDDAVLADVVAEQTPEGATTSVSAQVPHHADGSWPTPPTVDGTCLDGGPQREAVTLDRAPLGGDGATEGSSRVGWERDEPDADERALLDDVAVDPWVASLEEAELDYGTLRTGDNRRSADPASGRLPPPPGARAAGPRATVAAVVGDMSGWEPVWASCTRDTVDVRLRLVTDHGVAVTRLLGDAPSAGSIDWELGVSPPEAPVAPAATEATALDDSACLDPSAELPDGIVVEGTPVALLSTVQPIAG